MLLQSALNKVGLVPDGCDWLFLNSIQSESAPNNIGLSYLNRDSGEVEEMWYNKFHLANNCKVWLASIGFVLITTIKDNLDSYAVLSVTSEDGEEFEMVLYGADEPDVVFKATNKATLLIKALENA
jgi:hypothetical protein